MNIQEYFKPQLETCNLLTEEQFQLMIENKRKAGVPSEQIEQFENETRPKIGKERMMYFMTRSATSLQVFRIWTDELGEIEKSYNFIEMVGNLPKFELKG